MRKPISLLAALGLSLAGLGVTAPASAHISLERGGTHLSRYGDSEIKAGPCGRANGTRGKNVYTYEPGTTITVSLVEFVPHPSYFRFAFDNDGDDAFTEPASILPIDPARKCPTPYGTRPSDGVDHCNKSDFYNSPAVLPGMDNLDPHLAGSGAPKWTFQVKLPDVECTNCTLQVIQVMEDDTFHGPYDPTPGVGTEDIYHQCIDLVLKRGASVGDAGNPTPPATNDAGGPGTGGTGGDVDSGTGTGTGGTGGGTGGTGGGTGTGGGPGTIPGTGGGTGADAGSGAAAADGGSSGGCASSGRGAAGSAAVAWTAIAVGLMAARRRRRA